MDRRIRKRRSLLTLLLGTPMTDVQVASMPFWYVRLHAARCAFGEGLPRTVSRGRLRELRERAAKVESLEARLAKWEALHPEDLVWVVVRGGDRRADVYDERWRVDLKEGDEVEDPRSTDVNGRRRVVFG